jgi:hypothetical protein
LHHPGDSFSYDMYSQAGQLVRSPSGPLQGLKIKKVIAVGESQSAFRMVNYVNGIHPVAKVYDGYLIHSRGSIDTGGLSQPPQPNIPTPGDAAIRADIDVPVLTSRRKAISRSSATSARGRTTRRTSASGKSPAPRMPIRTRLWSARPTTATRRASSTSSHRPLRSRASSTAPHPSTRARSISCSRRRSPRSNKWVRKGKAPKSAPRLEVNAGPPVTIVTDEHGNGVGGIRTPQVDVPIATFTGQQSGSILCMLFGTTTVFTDAQLAALYPSHKDFVSKYKKAIKRSQKAGWILAPDAKLMKKWAVSSTSAAERRRFGAPWRHAILPPWPNDRHVAATARPKEPPAPAPRTVDLRDRDRGGRRAGRARPPGRDVERPLARRDLVAEPARAPCTRRSRS